SYYDVPTISSSINYTFDVYQLSGCPTSIPSGAKPIASVNFALVVPTIGGPATILEFYNASLDHYFISWMPEEIAKLDAATVIKGWARTGKAFKTLSTAQNGTS